MGSENGHSENEKHGASHRKERMSIMKKKLFPLILAVLLLFTACSAPVVTEANKLGAISYPGMEWLISPETMMKTIDKTSESFEITEENLLRYTLHGETVLGQKASVIFTFDVNEKDNLQRLYQVEAVFDDTSKDNYEALKKSVEQEIARQQVSVEWSEILNQVIPGEGETVSIEPVPIDTEPLSNGATAYYFTYCGTSTTNTADLPDEIQKKATEYAMSVSENTHLREDTKYGEVINMPLSSVNLYYAGKADGTQEIRLLFGATGYVSMMEGID